MGKRLDQKNVYKWPMKHMNHWSPGKYEFKTQWDTERSLAGPNSKDWQATPSVSGDQEKLTPTEQPLEL